MATKKIFKFALDTAVNQTVEMPVGSKILCLKVQYDVPC